MESVETAEDEGPEVSLNDILETSISNFTALRRSFSNYTHFREEARQLMLSVYHRHEVSTTLFLKNAKLVFLVIIYYLTVRLPIMSLNIVSESSWQNLNVQKVIYCEV